MSQGNVTHSHLTPTATSLGHYPMDIENSFIPEVHLNHKMEDKNCIFEIVMIRSTRLLYAWAVWWQLTQNTSVIMFNQFNQHQGNFLLMARFYSNKRSHTLSWLVRNSVKSKTLPMSPLCYWLSLTARDMSANESWRLQRAGYKPRVRAVKAPVSPGQWRGEHTL